MRREGHAYQTVVPNLCVWVCTCHTIEYSINMGWVGKRPWAIRTLGRSEQYGGASTQGGASSCRDDSWDYIGAYNAAMGAEFDSLKTSAPGAECLRRHGKNRGN